MTTFAIICPVNNANLPSFLAAMNRVFPNGAYRNVDVGQYVAVKANATSQQITNELGGHGEAGSFAVFASAGHWGFHDKNLWEWLSAWGAPT